MYFRYILIRNLSAYHDLQHIMMCFRKTNEISNNSLLRIPMNNEEIVQGSHTFKNCK